MEIAAKKIKFWHDIFRILEANSIYVQYFIPLASFDVSLTRKITPSTSKNAEIMIEILTLNFITSIRLQNNYDF